MVVSPLGRPRPGIRQDVLRASVAGILVGPGTVREGLSGARGRGLRDLARFAMSGIVGLVVGGSPIVAVHVRVLSSIQGSVTPAN